MWCCPALYLGQNETALVESARAGGAEIVEVAEAPFRKASYRDRPEGLLAVARQFPTGLDRLDLGPALPSCWWWRASRSRATWAR